MAAAFPDNSIEFNEAGYMQANFSDFDGSALVASGGVTWFPWENRGFGLNGIYIDAVQLTRHSVVGATPRRSRCGRRPVARARELRNAPRDIPQSCACHHGLRHAA